MPLQQAESITAAEVDRALQAVLSRPEYSPRQPSLLRRLTDSVADWFSTEVWPAITRILPIPDASDPIWDSVGRVVLVLGALVGAAVLTYWSVRAVRWLRHRRQARAGGESETGRPGPLTAGDWDVRARAAADQGDWRDAAHALYQATLMRLGDTGVVRVDGSKTPGDYRREARDSAILPQLDGFLRWFERIAYGRVEPGPAQYERLSETARTLATGG